MATKKTAGAAQQAAVAIHKKEAAATKTIPKKAATTKTAPKKAAAKKSSATGTAAKTAPAKGKAAKTTAGTKSAGKGSAGQKTSSKRAGSLPKEGKDPKGGLTAAGRKFYNEQTGGHLKPGVKGVADTAEKKKRKGSFLTRHFTTPPGPVVKDGVPTRQALQAAAWGEPVPKTEEDEKKLAEKGRQLLEEAKAGPKGKE